MMAIADSVTSHASLACIFLAVDNHLLYFDVCWRVGADDHGGPIRKI